MATRVAYFSPSEAQILMEAYEEVKGIIKKKSKEKQHRGYGCQPFLLTPFTDPQEAQQAYNHAHAMPMPGPGPELK